MKFNRNALKAFASLVYVNSLFLLMKNLNCMNIL